MNRHLTDYELNELMAVSGSSENLKNLNAHIATCDSCRERFAGLHLLDASLKNLETPPSDERQVHVIMDRLAAGEGESWTWTVGVRFAYVIGMLVVLAVTGWIFSTYGMLDVSPLSSALIQPDGTIQQIVRSVQDQINGYLMVLNRTYVKFFGREGTEIGFTVVIMLVLVALLDRWIIAPLLRNN